MIERELNVRKATTFVPNTDRIHALVNQPGSYRAETVLVVEEVSMLQKTAGRSVMR
jgi:hypothetical protein